MRHGTKMRIQNFSEDAPDYNIDVTIRYNNPDCKADVFVTSIVIPLLKLSGYSPEQLGNALQNDMPEIFGWEPLDAADEQPPNATQPNAYFELMDAARLLNTALKRSRGQWWYSVNKDICLRALKVAERLL